MIHYSVSIVCYVIVFYSIADVYIVDIRIVTSAGRTFHPLGGHQKGVVANLRCISSTNFPYINICLLVWDSGLQLFMKVVGNSGNS